MLNLKSFEEFVTNLILESQILFSQRKDTSTEYKKFSKDITKRIFNRENANEHYKWDFSEKYALVVNDADLSNTLQHMGCNVLYIHMDNSDKISEGVYFEPEFGNSNITNSFEFEKIIDEYLQSQKDSENNPIKAFDIVINVSIPIYADDIPEHSYNYETVAKINEMIFNATIMHNKMGIDRTLYYTIDDKDTYHYFYNLINKKRDKDIIPEVIGNVINKVLANKYGFDVDDERTFVRIFVRSLGSVRADTLDKQESEETGETVTAKGVFVGRTNPNIYCFKTPNVSGCLKVGDTFRPIDVRMDEWKDVFGNEDEGFEHEDDWEWSAVENNWVFRDYTVHKYLKDMKKQRLYNRSQYAKYFTPISETYTLDKTYSNEFFVDTTPEDVENAVNTIKKDIRENIDTLRDSLKRLDDTEESGIPFYDERELQKRCIDNFTKKINEDGESKNFLIYAVMRFGKTYTAIRCLQEFYKNRKDSCHHFSVIATAKPEVKNEWIGSVEKYISDSIDETGKGGYDKDIEDTEEHKFTKRTFDDFVIYDVDSLRREVQKFFNKLKKTDPDVYNEFVLKEKVKKKTYVENVETYESSSGTIQYLAEHALEKYIELGGNKGKHIILFASSQDLAGSNTEIKYKHKFFYDCPLDMIILDETHFGVRARSYGAATDTTKTQDEEYYVPEEDDIPKDEKGESESAKEEAKTAAKRFNKLNITEETIKLHLSGTPYKILKNKEFNSDNILASFTSTHLRLEKEKWEKENLPKRIAWEEEQEKLREAGDPEAKEEWENPYSADKNPYFGIPKLSHYSYDLSKFELASLKGDTSSTTCMEELFRVKNRDTGKIITSKDYEENNAKNIPIEFVHKDDVIKLFRIIDGAKREGEEKKILSILNIPEIKKGNMCKNILIALPFKDSCDCLAQLLNEEDPEKPGEKLFKILGSYEIINAAGRRDATDNPIKRIRGIGEKTITLTSSLLLTGVTVEPWDTIFYMKDGKSPEPYDQAKFRVQSPYINKLPIFDKSILSGGKPPVLKQDLKPQTLFVDFLPTRMLKILDDQMYNEQIITGNTSSEILKSTPVVVIEGEKMIELDAPGFSDYCSNMIAKDGGDPGYKRLVKKIHCPDSFLFNDEVMDALWEFHDYTQSGSDDDDENSASGGGSAGGTGTTTSKKRGGVKPTPKPKSKDKLREARRERFESFINGMAIYDILRKDRESVKLAVHDDVLQKMIDSVGDEKNKGIVHAVFFNNNFNVSDETCVDKVTAMLTKLKTVFGKESMTRKGVEIALSRVETIMNKKSTSNYKKVSTMFSAAGNSRLGATEYVSDPRLIERMVNSDFVIFNNGCKVLDAYGSKIGEFADYILNNDRIKTEKGFVDPKNYYILCYTHLTYEMNKFVLIEMGVPKKNILLCNNVKQIEENLGNMTFQVIVGNPPFKGGVNPLYMKITKSIYTHNMNKDSVMCMIHPTALVDNNFEGNPTYLSQKDKYGDLKLMEFYYDPKIRGTFVSAEIGNDIGVFIYGFGGKYSVFDEDIKKIRYGKENYEKSKSIIDKIRLSGKKFIGEYPSYKHIEPRGTEYKSPESIYTIMSHFRGNTDKKNGGILWDWPTLMKTGYFIPYNRIPKLDASNSVDFGNNYDDAVNLIKWVNTDFIEFIVLFYKNAQANLSQLFDRLPQPIKSGDFSDNSIMSEFGLSEEDMEFIHTKMRDFGWKTKDNNEMEIALRKEKITKIPTIKLNGTQDNLLKYIDELNKLNDIVNVDTSSYVPEEEEENEEYSETDAEPEDSPSSSEPLPDEIYDLDIKRLKAGPDTDGVEKYKEDDLKKKYPSDYKRFLRDIEDEGDSRRTFRQWLYDEIDDRRYRAENW